MVYTWLHRPRQGGVSGAKKDQVVQQVRALLALDGFKASHRTEPQYFTRNRALTFPLVILLILQKSVKSMQLVLNEFFGKLRRRSVTSSAFTQARAHLLHTAFIELNQKAVVGVCYGDGDYRRYQGFRLLAIDGSKIHLPDTPAVRDAFGTIDHNPACGQPQPYALASVVYDLLNRIALDARLAEATAYEVELALQQLELLEANDLVVFDRNYTDYALLAYLTHRQRHYLGRARRSSFSAVRRMFDQDSPESRVVTVRAPKRARRGVRAMGLPERITFRLVRLILPTGEIEVLITSLLDDVQFPVAELAKVYGLRWREETFYGVLKTRLALENFTGQTAEAVRQDFHASVFITGLESFFIDDAQARLDERSKENQYPQQVNKQVSFNAIKNQVLELFYSETDEAAILEQLTDLFTMKPISVRKGRVVPRREQSDHRLLDYHKRRKKACF